MNHLLSETARAAHCVPRCKYLMSLKYPDMLELSVKRFSVLSTERDGRQCGCQEAYLLTNIAKQKVHADSTWRLTLSPKTVETHQHSFRDVGMPLGTVEQWRSLGSYRLGQMVKYG